MKTRIYFKDLAGKLRCIGTTVDSLNDIVKDVAGQRVFAAYIQKETGIQVTMPVLAIIK